MMKDSLEGARAYLEREIELGLQLLPKAGAERAGADTGSGADDSVRIDNGAAMKGKGGQQPTAERSGRRVSKVSDAAESTISDLMVEPAITSAKDLPELRAVLGDCTRCKLAGGRSNIVFGAGSADADLMFVGEGPGEEEDKQGLPFVGRAGGLLTDIITKGMGLAREDVYIANVVKCRPPGNRNPEPDEIVACEPFLARQIALIEPKVLVSLGTFATQALLKNRVPISRQRGQWADYCGVPVMPTFHPAYLLRNSSGKRMVWEDVQLVMERLGISLPKKG